MKTVKSVAYWRESDEKVVVFYPLNTQNIMDPI